jgi:hypothetical protein
MKIKKRLQAPKLLTLAANDRIMMLFAAVHLSAYGTKGHSDSACECPLLGIKRTSRAIQSTVNH